MEACELVRLTLNKAIIANEPKRAGNPGYGTFLETTFEIDLLALVLMRQYGFTSIFDAYQAATALNQVEDHTIVSTDKVFDCIPGLVRVDPRKIWGYFAIRNPTANPIMKPMPSGNIPISSVPYCTAIGPYVWTSPDIDSELKLT
jgi:hypothetical protein